MINLNFKPNEITIYTNCESNRYNLINSVGHKILRNGMTILQVNEIGKLFKNNNNFYDYDYILINSINNNEIETLKNLNDNFNVGVITTIGDLDISNIKYIDKIIEYNSSRKK